MPSYRVDVSFTVDTDHADSFDDLPASVRATLHEIVTDDGDVAVPRAFTVTTEKLTVRAWHSGAVTDHGVSLDIDRWTNDHTRTISALSAGRIASWYQSPGTVGSVLASLASGVAVGPDELLDDIDRTRRESNEVGSNDLDALADWVRAQN